MSYCVFFHGYCSGWQHSQVGVIVDRVHLMGDDAFEKNFRQHQ